jgi:tetratricopeptide (TPR) repeat protein
MVLPAAIGGREGHQVLEPGQLEEAARAEAVRLLVERARAVLPTFALGPGNVVAVVEICRRLDGIPLALELAAARVNVLSIQEIEQGLSDRFRLLTGGRRTALPRQQTLQALVDWSWDLLDQVDQRLLRRLSVFSGGWTLEAAASVTHAEVADGSDGRLATLDGLSRLVDRSLVVVDHDGSTRYRMLETIRQYARERLIDSGEVVLLRNRHLVHFLAVAQKGERALRGPDMIPWLVLLDAEADNLRTALDWSFETDPEQALRLTVALGPYWSSRSDGSEALERMQAAADLAQLVLPGNAEADRERGLLVSRALAAASFAMATWGNAAAARGWANRAVELARTTNDDIVLWDAMAAHFLVAVFSGDDEADISGFLAEAERIAKQGGDWWRLAMALASGAMVQMMQGDIAGAEGSIARATEAAEHAANPFVIAYTAVARGNLSDQAGRLADARHWFATAIAAYEQMGDRRFVLIARSDLAHALRHGGALEEADALYRETLRDWQYAGNRGAVANQLECLAYLAIVKGDAVRAARLLGAAEALREVADAPLLSSERPEYDAQVERLREQLDEVALGSAWAGGRAMTADEAVEFALSE